MSSFDKTVKLACKPKAAPPKAKYIDPIIAATYSEDGAVHDVCKALSPRLREPNVIIVYKALIVLHTMIRNGATDNVLSYLSSDDVLRLKSVSAGHWDGYDTPRNLQNYALYLDARIRTYKDLKHDPVRVQSDSNRDARVESTFERSSTARASNGPQRSKTIMGRKLRSMTVEKGLLRETKAVQRTINALLECKFYFDNLDDELNVTALRMLVKDLLVLFQALNEGVINVLEHYFEMSHVDAETALGIYRNFCKQTEKVVEYLGVARKLQNMLNVPIPNLKHAPVSLVSALEEYLNDPNFEQNRIEYKTTRSLADKNAREGNTAPNGVDHGKPSSSSAAPTSSTNAHPSSLTKPSDPENKALVDFFSSIEGEQTSMFSPSNSQLQQQQQQMQQQATHNPFALRQSMMITGAFPQQQPFGQPQMPQPTGFVQPQQTAFPGAFQQPQPTGLPQSQHPSFSSFLRPQTAQPTGFLQPQATGANPFRQSMLMPQSTGFPAFGLSGGPASNVNTFQSTGAPFSVPQPTGQPQSAQASTKHDDWGKRSAITSETCLYPVDGYE
ncbi:ANTH-domain-containing protein [Fomitiporia mediterranea MF3/22]|uniref:ANTH-domain-containing protein n=1 Tax=Fomitiporia mediterranea (strain MF3/22) TaxID=694068 RepID=UPI0004408549|nr:ANTH-domain-containing protein [Fomitiporia mediterranea MF3/22]EJD07686.1 ANTH-domain-containing protein [Fomitiporia mediterranea MF3/22]